VPKFRKKKLVFIPSFSVMLHNNMSTATVFCCDDEAGFHLELKSTTARCTTVPWAGAVSLGVLIVKPNLSRHSIQLRYRREARLDREVYQEQTGFVQNGAVRRSSVEEAK